MIFLVYIFVIFWFRELKEFCLNLIDTAQLIKPNVIHVFYRTLQTDELITEEMPPGRGSDRR